MKQTNKTILNLFLVILFMVVNIGCETKKEDQNYRYDNKIQINEKIISVEIADIDKTRTKGLSGRKSLLDDEGMLFIFNNPEIYQFHMKDMNFPLDFIWIENNKIVDVTENVSEKSHQPPDYLMPDVPVDQVLEVKAGFIQKNNIKIGDKVSH